MRPVEPDVPRGLADQRRQPVEGVVRKPGHARVRLDLGGAQHVLEVVDHGLHVHQVDGAGGALQVVQLPEDLVEQSPALGAGHGVERAQAPVDRLELSLRLVREGREEKLLKLVG